MHFISDCPPVGKLSSHVTYASSGDNDHGGGGQLQADLPELDADAHVTSDCTLASKLYA